MFAAYPSVCSGGDGTELGQLLHVLVMLLLLAVLLAAGLGLAAAAAVNGCFSGKKCLSLVKR